MKSGSGPKTRRITADNATSSRLFEFNKSISPHGGTLSRISTSLNKEGYGIVKIFQDSNDNGKVERKELIYKGKSRTPFSDDELTDFSGRIKLKKTMHMCDWLSMKFPNEKTILCTMELIPTTYACSLIDQNGDRYKFDGIGNFKDGGREMFFTENDHDALA